MAYISVIENKQGSSMTLNKYDLILIAMMIFVGLAGNMFFEDDILQSEVNCSRAAYALDHEFECKRVGE